MAVSKSSLPDLIDPATNRVLCKYDPHCYRINKDHMGKYHHTVSAKPNTQPENSKAKIDKPMLFCKQKNTQENTNHESKAHRSPKTHKRNLSAEIEKNTGMALPKLSDNFEAENQTGPFLAAKALEPYYEIVKKDNEVRLQGKKDFSISEAVNGLDQPCNVEVVIVDHKITMNKHLLISGRFEYQGKIIHEFDSIRLHFKHEHIMQGVVCSDVVVNIIDYKGPKKLPRIIWSPNKCLKNLQKYPGSIKAYQILKRLF